MGQVAGLHIESISYRKGDPLPDISADVEAVVSVFGLDRNDPFLNLAKQVEGLSLDAAKLFYYRVRYDDVPSLSNLHKEWERDFLAHTLEERNSYARANSLLRNEIWKNVAALIQLRTDHPLPDAVQASIDQMVGSMQNLLSSTQG